MGNNYLTEGEARDLVESSVSNEGKNPSTQEILDSGAVPRLQGYTVKPGKVSYSIFGGEGSYIDKETKKRLEFENPPLETFDGAPLRMMDRTDGISTHDIKRGGIPFKDQLLALNHNYMRRLVQGIIGTSQYNIKGLKDNSVVIGAENLEIIPLEMVLRDYMAKSNTSTNIYQAYFIRGERKFSDHILPEGLIINGKLPYLMDTPSTKAEKDKTVDFDYVFKNIVDSDFYNEIRVKNLSAFARVKIELLKRGLLLFDTKIEQGFNAYGEILSQDELFTMDSSRYCNEEDYNKQMELFLKGDEAGLISYLQETQPGIKEKDYRVLDKNILGEDQGDHPFYGKIHIAPLSLSKEFARGKSEGEKGYSEEDRIDIAVRYILGLQHLLGKRFVPDMRSREERVVSGLQTIVDQLVA